MNPVGGAQTVLRNAEIGERFAQLTQLLKAGEQFWRDHAFQYLQLPWEREYPALSRQLRALSLDEAEHFARDNRALLDLLGAYLPGCANIASACDVGDFTAPPLPDIEPRDIPGRKWQQLRHFVPCIPANEHAVLEWCAGKAHLGRTLAQQRGCAVTALEYNAQLVAAGHTQALRAHAAIDFHCVDVMAEQAAAYVRKNQNAIALHACGDLHAQLLMCCARMQTQTLTLAPCCYHLSSAAARYTLSQAAHASGLRLRREDLRTAVHGTVTAPARQNQQRRQLQAWRLGFDLLQRELRGAGYLPTPSLSVHVLHEGFAAFCRRVAAAKRVPLPAAVDYPRYERAGGERLRAVTALDLPRLAFRRALELWLVLDRALFLVEHGYAVEVGVFCAASLTPRNLLLRAQAGSA